jgi:hypothetical protein
LDRRLGGPQSRSERGGEKENSQPLPRLEPTIIQPVAQRSTTDLTRLVIVSGEVFKDLEEENDWLYGGTVLSFSWWEWVKPRKSLAGISQQPDHDAPPHQPAW